MSGVTYDSGALIAAERGSVSVWALHRRLLERGVCPIVSTPVLGQAWRGGPQAQLSRLLRGCRVEPLTEPQARAAGAALAASNGEDIVDAVVVVSALLRAAIWSSRAIPTICGVSPRRSAETWLCTLFEMRQSGRNRSEGVPQTRKNALSASRLDYISVA